MPEAHKSSLLQPATLKEFNNLNVLERGHIFFLYRPKVMKEQVHDFNEVQKLVIVLKPQRLYAQQPVSSMSTEQEPARVLMVPKKTLPSKGEKRLAIVTQVDSDIDQIVKKSLSEEHYQTFTRGERELGACRLLGEGLYELIEHRENHTHLSYVLEFPKTWEPNSVQAEFGIQKEDTLILSAKNPQTYTTSFSTASEGPSASSSTQTKKGHKEIPQKVIDLFQGKTFLKINPPSILSHEGLQLLLIGAVEYDERGVALVEEDLKREHEKLEWEARVEASHLDSSNPPLSLLERELHLKSSDDKENEKVNMDVMDTGEFE
ncbi:hypothetical protein C9374_000782 [Naegleria lovaniensis]|uniref:Uncharacterized protein n=1 Tax=Naegleria lovaniensis TaxID=51637 RepID=A0AA88GVS9_NAELO|nr:uncharacterized protein C9374_000782 [Naegleria lovaniensis]KAG2387932.1 hypothetical protein C9374_000782 [Naegleria lovaniensis]